MATDEVIDQEAGAPEPTKFDTVLKYAMYVIGAAVVVAIIAIGWALFNPPSMPRTSAELNLEQYKRMVREQPQSAVNHLRLASAYLEIEDDKNAIQEFNRSLAIDSKVPLTHYGLAQAMRFSGDQKGAIKELKAAIKLKKGYMDAYYDLGGIYLETRQPKEAVKILEQALKQESGDAEMHYLLGSAYEMQGDAKKAQMHYEEALRYVPEYPEAAAALKRVKPTKSK